MQKNGREAYSYEGEPDFEDIFDAGANRRAKLGFMLLATEQTIEENMFRLCPSGVGIHFARAYNPDSITVQSRTDRAHDLARAACTLWPDGSLAASVDRPEADAVFISCGALRSIDIIEELEQKFGKPVISSNQAMMWDMLRLAGINDRI